MDSGILVFILNFGIGNLFFLCYFWKFDEIVLGKIKRNFNLYKLFYI